MKPIIIAIDGFSSCGKSTVAKAIARELGYAYVDTGAMYRAVTLFFLNNTIDCNDVNAVNAALNEVHVAFHYNSERGMSDCWLNGHDVEEQIRTMAVAEQVSKVSQIKAVRQHLVNLQQQMGAKKGLVMDGRDIGTAVFPEAELKIFMTADPKIRAERRFKELQAKGQHITMEEVAQNLLQRDHDDTHRTESPLTKADDALVLDNSYITETAQLSMALQWAKERMLVVVND